MRGELPNIRAIGSSNGLSHYQRACMSTILTLFAVPLIAAGTAMNPLTSHTASDSSAAALARDSSKMTLVVVQNNAKRPVTVYAQNAVGEFKLGVVDANDTGTLRLPDWVIALDPSIDFFVDPKGGGFSQDSGILDMRRGEHLGLVFPGK